MADITIVGALGPGSLSGHHNLEGRLSSIKLDLDITGDHDFPLIFWGPTLVVDDNFCGLEKAWGEKFFVRIQMDFYKKKKGEEA